MKASQIVSDSKAGGGSVATKAIWRWFKPLGQLILILTWISLSCPIAVWWAHEVLMAEWIKGMVLRPFIPKRAKHTCGTPERFSNAGAGLKEGSTKRWCSSYKTAYLSDPGVKRKHTDLKERCNKNCYDKIHSRKPEKLKLGLIDKKCQWIKNVVQ